MGRAKKIYYNSASGALQGTLLTGQDCATLDDLLSLQENLGCVSDLKHIIYDLEETEVDAIKAGADPESIERGLGTLEDVQTIGVAYMYFAKRLVLGDSVGMGKTVQIAGLMNLLEGIYAKQGQPFRYLICTDNDVVDQFRDELIRFTGQMVYTASGKKNELLKFLSDYPDYDLPNIVAPSSILRQPVFQEYLRASEEASHSYGFPFNALVIDESAAVANTSTKTFVEGTFIRDRVEYVYAMNATSFESNLMSFVSQIEFVDPTLLPTKTAIQDLYCQKSKALYGNYYTPNGKYKNQDKLRDQIRYRYLKRTRRELGAEFRDCTAELRVVPLSPVQRHMLKNTSFAHMVYDNPCYFDKGIEFNGENNPKAGEVRDILTGKKSTEGRYDVAETVLIYSFYKESQEDLANFLREAGITCRVMNGDTPKDVRQEIISDFRNAEFRVLITNVMKGLNFGSTDHAIAYTSPGNVNKMVQFEGRMTRSFNIIGKHLLVLATSGPEEKYFNEILRARAAASNAFAGSDHSLFLSILSGKN